MRVSSRFNHRCYIPQVSARGKREKVTATKGKARRSIASNRRARHDYTILKTYEAGIVLVGNEVKSLRAGHASLTGAFVQEHDGELMLHGPTTPQHPAD